MQHGLLEIDSRFLIDTAFHRSEIIRDDGLYRHLRSAAARKRPVITTTLSPGFGYLTVTGDMGTWTFSRIADMFDFWRTEGGINTITGLEKLEAGAGCSAREMLAKSMTTTRSAKSLKDSLNVSIWRRRRAEARR